jgi:hypothetical protein
MLNITDLGIRLTDSDDDDVNFTRRPRFVPEYLLLLEAE